MPSSSRISHLAKTPARPPHRSTPFSARKILPIFHLISPTWRKSARLFTSGNRKISLLFELFSLVCHVSPSDFAIVERADCCGLSSDHTNIWKDAGLQFPAGLHLTEDRVEKTFAINHLGHALLFHLLAPHLEKGARILITASGTHDPAQKTDFPEAKYTSAEELAHPPPEAAKTDGRQRYSTSKLVNIMWIYALQRRLVSHPERQLTVVAFDPGLMPGTGLAREYSVFVRFVWNSILPRLIPLLRRFVHPNVHTAKESGESLAWVAVSDEVASVSGVYYEGRKEIKSSVDSYDKTNQESLWEWTVKNVASSEEEARKFEDLR